MTVTRLHLGKQVVEGDQDRPIAQINLTHQWRMNKHFLNRRHQWHQSECITEEATVYVPQRSSTKCTCGAGQETSAGTIWCSMHKLPDQEESFIPKWFQWRTWYWRVWQIG